MKTILNQFNRVEVKGISSFGIKVYKTNADQKPTVLHQGPDSELVQANVDNGTLTLSMSGHENDTLASCEGMQFGNLHIGNITIGGSVSGSVVTTGGSFATIRSGESPLEIVLLVDVDSLEIVYEAGKLTMADFTTISAEIEHLRESAVEKTQRKLQKAAVKKLEAAQATSMGKSKKAMRKSAEAAELLEEAEQVAPKSLQKIAELKMLSDLLAN
jgi:hypothetical protein